MKRRSLVCQHLERISRAVLERHQHIVRQYVRGRHGVYALYRKEKLYYVGLASNLRGRLKSHLKDKHGGSWDKFSVYLTIGDQHLRELESLLLRIGRPIGNRVAGRFARSDDLRRRLKRDLLDDLKRQADEIMGRARPGESRKRPGRKTKTKGLASRLAKLIDRRMDLRGKHLGRRVYARLRLDGRVRYKGHLYDSPSKAASVARSHPTNGWWFWQYERAPGDWVPLNTLRR